MDMILKAFAAGVVSSSFAMLFQIHGRKVFFAALCGAVGYLVYLLLFGVSSLFALFMASMAMAMYSEVMARKLKTPATMFMVAGLIPIVPGGGMFSFILKAMEGQLSEAASIGLNTLMEAGAIAGGIIILYSLWKMTSKIFNTGRR